MKIDFKDIAKIKDIKSLKKYKLNKPIFLNNYLFHYLIMTNNLKGLKLYNFPIYKKNEDGLSGFHLAAYYDFDDILEYLIETYPNHIYNKTDEYKNFIWFNSFTNKNILNMIVKYNLDLELLFYDFIEFNKGKKNILEMYFELSTYKIIKKILNDFDLDYDKIFNEKPIFFELLSNENLSYDNKVEFLNILKKNKKINIYNYYDDMGMNICWRSLSIRNIKLFKFINKCDFNDTLPLTTYNFFRTAYNTDVNENNFKISKYIWNKIKKNFNYTSINKYGDTIAHFLLNTNIKTGSNDKLTLEILKNFDYWNNINTDKETPVHYIIFCNFDKYYKLLKGKNLDLSIKNKNNETALDLANGKWSNFLKKLPKFNVKNIDIKLKNYKYANGNIFQSRFLDLSIFLLELVRKYKQLYLPRMIDNNTENITWDQGLIYPDNYLEKYLNFPWIIIWNNKSNYWIHPYLNDLIKSTRLESSHDFCAIMLSIRLPDDGLHAGLILYDFKRNTIERFDPYGDTCKLDIFIDEVLEEELTWNTGFAYLKPCDFMTTSGFQAISNENSIENQKYGDYGGYCLAWCLWYLEHRMNNEKIDSKKLFIKTRKKMLNNDISFNEYIRNYANDINKLRVKTLKKIGIPKNKISNEYLESKYNTMIFDYIIDNM